MAGHRYSDGRWVTVDSHGGDGYQPDGTVAQVVDWVGGDLERARLAYDAELARARPRAGVLDVADRLLADA